MLETELYIPLKRSGEVIAYATVDEADGPLVEGYTWGLHQGRATVKLSDRSRVSMSVLLLGLDPHNHRLVEHRNGNTLDNRRTNLHVTGGAR